LYFADRIQELLLVLTDSDILNDAFEIFVAASSYELNFSGSVEHGWAEQESNEISRNAKNIDLFIISLLM
jgi:hypothetical protein